ncbi:sigma factor [Streptomyces sp. NPDC017979]|uniref:sigma factor n=1 Tax=Streptomyces sp. NPDC017979 TaxID=3365024 RepID=UPI00378E8AD2
MNTRPEQEDGRLDAGLSAVLSGRRQLINLAYRFLGSMADAEDIAQETYARWCAMTPQAQDAVVSPGGRLTTVASSICLDLPGSARAKRERYVGECVSEPLPERTEWISAPSTDSGDPADRVTLDESVSTTFLPIEGREAVARFFVNAAHNANGLTMAESKVNGQPGLILQRDGATVSVLAFDVSDERITRIWAVLNPEKLRPWAT